MPGPAQPKETELASEKRNGVRFRLRAFML